MHELTYDERAKGGRSKSITKIIAHKLIHRVKCDSSCPIFPCILQPYVDKETYECPLANKSEKDKNLFVNILFGKENGLNKVLLENAFLIAKNREELDPFLLMKINDSLINIKKAIYGTKKTIRSSKSQEIYDTMKEIVIDTEINED